MGKESHAMTRVEALEVACQALVLCERDRMEASGPGVNGPPLPALYNDAVRKAKRALGIKSFAEADTRELPAFRREHESPECFEGPERRLEQERRQERRRIVDGEVME